MNYSPISARRYDLDWLRIIAFFLLIYYHASILFTPGGFPMIQNAETSTVMGYAADFLHEFRLALLFLISGFGISFSRRQRSEGNFLRERSVRLLIPMGFGIAVVIPPMVFAEKLFTGAFSGSFLDFYPEFFTDGVYPSGNLSWHHFWFIAYLYLHCLMGIPLFRHLDSHAGKLEIRWIEQHAKGPRIYLYILPLVIIEIALRAFFHGVPNLINDWANFFLYFLILLAGYVFSSSETLLNRTASIRWTSLPLAISTTTLLFHLFHMPDGGFAPGPVLSAITIPQYLLFCVVRIANIWFWLMAIVGWAGHCLQFDRPILRYLTEAVYPLFILHLTIIASLGYWIVELSLNLWLKYIIVTTTTLFSCLAIYHYVIRPSRLLRACFGVHRHLKAGQSKQVA